MQIFNTKYITKLHFNFLIVFAIFLIQKCNVSNNNSATKNQKYERKGLISGINMEAPPRPIDSTCFTNMHRVGAKWVSIIPFAFSRQGETMVRFNEGRQWWGETKDGIIACIELAHKSKMKVMLKPQLWIGGGVYTGHFKCDTDSTWKVWESNYLKYILHNATIAQNTKAELFCIGTELDFAVKERPVFWSRLIDSVKKIYTGDLTYAANWGSFKKFTSWEKLNYIGVDAYFPLSKAVTPTVDELLLGWQPHYIEIKKFAELKNKPILFTEYGYRSIDKCAEEPWISNTQAPINMQAQQNAYEALYTQFIPQSWFAGGFLWKWHTNDTNAGGSTNNNYTPQHKPAELTIKKWYNGE